MYPRPCKTGFLWSTNSLNLHMYWYTLSLSCACYCIIAITLLLGSSLFLQKYSYFPIILFCSVQLLLCLAACILPFHLILNSLFQYCSILYSYSEIFSYGLYSCWHATIFYVNIPVPNFFQDF